MVASQRTASFSLRVATARWPFTRTAPDRVPLAVAELVELRRAAAVGTSLLTSREPSAR